MVENHQTKSNLQQMLQTCQKSNNYLLFLSRLQVIQTAWSWRTQKKEWLSEESKMQRWHQRAACKQVRNTSSSVRQSNGDYAKNRKKVPRDGTVFAHLFPSGFSGDELVAATINLDQLKKEEVMKILKVLEPYNSNMKVLTKKELSASTGLGSLGLGLNDSSEVGIVTFLQPVKSKSFFSQWIK